MLCLSEIDESVFSVNAYEICYNVVIVRAAMFDEKIVHSALTDSTSAELIIIILESSLLHCLRIDFSYLFYWKQKFLQDETAFAVSFREWMQ